MSPPRARPVALAVLSCLVGLAFLAIAEVPAAAQVSREEYERRRRDREREQGVVDEPIVIERDLASEEIDRALKTPRSLDPPPPQAPSGVASAGPVPTPEPEGIDWPEWRGRGRRGVWDEGGILEAFPETGLAVRWRTPIRGGFSGPAVSGGRVYVSDFLPDPESHGVRGHERLHALDEATGATLWTHEWPVDYAALQASYATGPRATPTVDRGRVYVVGATGVLRCVAALTGNLIWEKDFARDYGTTIPTWGIASAPLVHGDRLIALVGGVPDAKVVAFDKRTGKEVWRALPADSEVGYGQPVLLHAGGATQLVVWHPSALSALDPVTGALLWEERWEAGMGMTVATPVRSGPYLLVSQFYRGSLMMHLDGGAPVASRLWQIGGPSELPEDTRSLHALITTPVIDDDHVYGIDSYGQLRCLDARTGERIWESEDLVTPGRWAAGFIVRRGDRYFVNTDEGDLVIARLSRRGYEELDRTRLIEPTTNSAWGRRRGLRKPGDRIVNWSHPAYANRHVFARNDHEILSASLARPAAGD